MKRILMITAILLLAGCQAKIPTALSGKVGLTDVLDEFSRLDAQLNTSWHDEVIPNNMIRVNAIKPWTEQILILKDKIETHGNDTFSTQLVDARIEMLRSQVAFYLAAQHGETGTIDYSINGTTLTVTEKINCADVPIIIESTKAYALSFKYFLRFNKIMDELLQNSNEAREKVGIGDKRPAFYKSPVFKDAENRIKLALGAIKEQCGAQVQIEPSP